ncbi:MAG TPA: HlyD family efflux transporter periplasmic adaptor subunit, partial [Lacipirellulaceae bacterium]|nr:HlyD family efflux transporter periplasmic adaptor subunit [Lacipirellulaceae bacterium]
EIPTRVFAPAGADIAGRVVEANFREGDAVRAGDVLVRLDAAQIDNRIEKVRRSLAAAQEELGKLAGLETLLAEQLAAAQAKAAAELAQAEAALARAADQRASAIRAAQAGVQAARDLVERRRQLLPSGAVTAEDVVKAEMALREAEEKLVAAELPIDEGAAAIARRAVALVDRDFAVRSAEAEARRAAKQGEVESLRRDLRQLELQLAESVLRSPIDGVVVAGQIRVGDVLEPGKAVMEIAPRDGYRFEAAILSEDVGNVQVGMPVRIKFDAYDYQRYGVLHGTVAYLSPDSQLPPSGPSGAPADATPASRKSPAAFLVRIELAADHVGRGEMHGPVKLGLGGTAEIVTDTQSVLRIFFKKIRQTISLG